MKALIVFISLALSNFAYQFVTGETSLVTAFERTWFQGTALFVYWLMDKYVWRN